MSPTLLRSFCLFVAISTLSLLQAQDLQYSLLEFMPTWVNPSLTGAYEGTARIGGVYRDQQLNNLSEDTYQTPGFYIDAPLVMLGKKAWLGVGGTLISDKAGFGDLTATYAQVSASYHRILDQGRDSRTVFSAGLMGGILNRSADLSSDRIILKEEQEVNIGGGGLTGGGLERAGNFGSTGINLGVGISLARQIDKERNFRIGVSARHLVPSDVELVISGGDKITRAPAIAIHGAYRQLIDDKYLIEPAVFIQTTENANSATAGQVQSMVGMYMGEESDKLIKVGLGVRLPTRFVYPMVGFEYKDFKVAASFDINANSLQTNADSFQQGFEIGVQYIFKIYKEPKVERVILCPQI